MSREEIVSLKLQIASAEQQRDRAREQALSLNQQLEARRFPAKLIKKKTCRAHLAEDSQVQTDELAQLREARLGAWRGTGFGCALPCRTGPGPRAQALEEAQRTSAFDKDALQQREQQDRTAHGCHTQVKGESQRRACPLLLSASKSERERD